jgi:flagellar protein FlbD
LRIVPFSPEVQYDDADDDEAGDPGMIKLTRLSGEAFILNADLIRFIESRPDTYITLTTDDRFIVREGADEVVQRAIEYARQVRLTPVS